MSENRINDRIGMGLERFFFSPLVCISIVRGLFVMRSDCVCLCASVCVQVGVCVRANRVAYDVIMFVKLFKEYLRKYCEM